MITSLEQVRKFLGKQLQDPYGRTHGKLIGITANLRDETTAVGVETANGEFAVPRRTTMDQRRNPDACPSMETRC